MKEEKQKVGQMRKREIREAAKKCFLDKGFQNTTMEDIITEIGKGCAIRYVFFSQAVSPISIEVALHHRPNIHPSQ